MCVGIIYIMYITIICIYTCIVIWYNVDRAHKSIAAENILLRKHITRGCYGRQNSKMVSQISPSLPSVCFPYNSWNSGDGGFYSSDEVILYGTTDFTKGGHPASTDPVTGAF